MIWSFLLMFVGGAFFGSPAQRLLRGGLRENVFTSADSAAADELRVSASQAVNDRIAKRKQRIVKAAREQGQITNDGVEDLFCISDRTASRYLQQLTEAGELTRHGTGSETYYTPN